MATNNFISIFDNKLTLKHKFQNLEFLLYASAVFMFPLLLGHVNTLPNQLIVGTFVNAFLVLGALYFGTKKLLPLIILPSIAALLTGFIFGPLSFYLLYLMPFIWVANAIFIYAIKRLKLNMQKNYFVSLITASFAKAIFLFSVTLALFYFSLVPEVFLTAMGLLQFTTAILGGCIASFVYFVRR
ncbi:MAG: hypothetical protein V1672_04645 [Candidatus Diapherotrites archaeon]